MKTKFVSIITLLLMAVAAFPTYSQTSVDIEHQVISRQIEAIERMRVMLEEIIAQRRSFMDQHTLQARLLFAMGKINMAKEIVFQDPLRAAQLATSALTTLQQYQLGDEQVYTPVREFIATAIQIYYSKPLNFPKIREL